MLYEVFCAFGKTEPGFVTAKELGPLLRALGDDPRPAELRDLIRFACNLSSTLVPLCSFISRSFLVSSIFSSLVDADGNGIVDYTEFLTLVAVRSQHAQSEEELLASFRMFDSAGTGTIPVSVFRQAMKQLCGLSPDEVESMITESREVTRQHVARLRDIESAKLERRAQRRQRKLDLERATVTSKGLASDAAAIGPAPELATASDHPDDSLRIPVPGVAGPVVPGVGMQAGAGLEKVPAVAMSADDSLAAAIDVIYYEPLVRILFSF
jgi:calmodulin